MDSFLRMQWVHVPSRSSDTPAMRDCDGIACSDWQCLMARVHW